MTKMIDIKEKINQISFETTTSNTNRPDIRVAAILDPFSYECFRYECTLSQISEQNWMQEINSINPDFLFVESVWEAWDFSTVVEDDDHELRKLISYCNRCNIKTVFWNKEDSINYNNFIGIAKLFDLVFTSDINCIDQYKIDLGHDNIFPLPFAAQPRIHNPIDSFKFKKMDTAFAGAWYNLNVFNERQKDMWFLLNGAVEFNLNIFDRKFHSTSVNFQFPDKFKPYIVGNLNYQDMIKAYKLYKVFLNVNSIKNSSTMFSRRVFELLASGTNVVSAYSKGISEMFDGIVSLVSTESETKKELSLLYSDEEYRRRKSVLGIREIHKKHLYQHRFEYILEKLNIRATRNCEIGVSIICIPNINNIKNVIKNYDSQKILYKELLLVIVGDKNNMYEMIGEREDIKFIYASCVKTVYLDALNEAKYEYVSFFNGNDYYASNYLLDLIDTFNYSKSPLTGKMSYFSYDQECDELVLNNTGEEYKYVNAISIDSLIARKQCFKKVITGESDLFTLDNNDTILSITNVPNLYSSDRYNYIKVKLINNCGNGFLCEVPDKFISKVTI